MKFHVAMILSLLAAVVVASSNVFAGQTGFRRITRIQADLTNTFYVRLDTYDNVNSCTSPDAWFMIADTDAAGAKNVIAAIYMAFATGKSVSIVTNSCQGAYNKISNLYVDP